MGTTVNFTDTSVIEGTAQKLSWAWNFGDDVGTSTEQNPSYTYSATGTYVVTLTVTDNLSNVSTISQSIFVDVPVAFEISANSGTFIETGNSVTIGYAVPFNTWATASPATSPGARAFASMAYYPGLGVIMVGGTTNGSSAIHDGPTGGSTAATWQWDGTNWTKLTPTTDAPAGFGGGLAYDSVNNILVWVPAYDSGNLDSWAEFNGTTWTVYSGSSDPNPHNTVWGNMAFDSNRGVTVYSYGFGETVTIEYNGATHSWSSTSGGEPMGYGTTMSFDPVHNQSMAFAGSSAVSPYTYVYSGATWGLQSPGTVPSSHYFIGLCSAWHGDRQTNILKTTTGTWEWNGTNWDQLTLASQGYNFSTSVPGGLIGPGSCMAFHSGNRTMVMFGGATPSVTNTTYVSAA
jgi:PKD repeat protein